MSDPLDTSERLSRLETIIDSISQTLDKIQTKLDQQGKINWAPIAIGVTVFFTVAGSVSTIYNARISTINNAVESIAAKTDVLEKGAVERQLLINVHEEKIKEMQKDIDEIQNEHKQRDAS